MKRRTLTIFTLILASGIFIYLLYNRNSDVMTSDTKDTNQSLKEHTVKSHTVVKSTPQKRKNLTAQLNRSRMEKITDDDGIMDAPIEDEELARRALMQHAVGTNYRKNVMAAFDQLVKDEPIDDEWTHGVQNGIRNVIEYGGFKDTLLKDATCHRTVCRIQITHKDQSERKMFFDDIQQIEVLDGPSTGFHRLNKDGTIDTTLYLGKRGQGDKMTLNVLERAYTIATGQPADSVVPTSSQIEQVAAARMQ